MRILLIEDDQATLLATQMALMSESFAVYTAENGGKGIGLAKVYAYDIILLDWHLPDISGYKVLCTLRSCKVKTPVMILSGLNYVEDKVRGLNAGADDFMVKPFNKDELFARICAIVRRSNGHTESTIKVGDLTIDLNSRRVEVGGLSIRLTHREYQVLELLSMRKGHVVRKDMIIDHLYSGIQEPDSDTVAVFISTTRKKLGSAGGHIKTHRGAGYILSEHLS